MAKRGREEYNPIPEDQNDSANGERNLINSAVSDGLETIFKDHPKFANYREYVTRNIDPKRLQRGLHDIGEYIQRNGQNWSEEEKIDFYHKNIANFVASGQAFNNSAKKVILERGLSERPYGRRNESITDKVGQATQAFKDIYDIMKSGGHDKRMPEIAKAAGQIYDLGFLDTAMDILESQGLVDKRGYNEIKKTIEKRRKEAAERYSTAVHKYTTPTSIAASIIGIIGIATMIIQKHIITGNVVGISDSNPWNGLFGFTLVLISIILYLSQTFSKKSQTL